MRTISSSIAILAVVGTPLFAEPGENLTGAVTLASAIQRALEQNPDVRAARWAVQAAGANALQEGLRPNPELEVEVEEFAGSGDLRNFDAAEYTLAISQEIQLGSKRSRRVKVATLERDLAEWDAQARRLAVVAQVRQSFTEALAAQELLVLAESLLQQAEELARTAERRIRAGAASPIEQLKADIEVAELRIARDQARRQVEHTHILLAGTWGSAAVTFTSVTGALDRIALPPDLNQLLDRNRFSPDLIRLAVERERLEASLQQARADRTPDLTLGGGIRWLSESDDQALVAGVGLPLPLFARNQGAIRAAEFELLRGASEHQARELEWRQAVATARQELVNAYHQAVAFREELLPRAHQAYEAARQGYQQGRFTHLDVLDAQRTLSEARGRYIETLAGYHHAAAEMDRLAGESPGPDVNQPNSLTQEKRP